MAVIKVFDSHGIKELNCFDTLADVDYLPEEGLVESPEDLEDEE